MNRKLLTNVFASLGIGIFTWPAQAAFDLDAIVPVGPQVKVGKLANGLTYYI